MKIPTGYSVRALRDFVGHDFGATPPLTVNQDTINTFAERFVRHSGGSSNDEASPPDRRGACHDEGPCPQTWPLLESALARRLDERPQPRNRRSPRHQTMATSTRRSRLAQTSRGRFPIRKASCGRISSGRFPIVGWSAPHSCAVELGSPRSHRRDNRRLHHQAWTAIGARTGLR